MSPRMTGTQQYSRPAMDSREFHRTCKEHAQALYAFFLANGVDHHHAQDLVQRSLVTLWEKQGRVLDGKAKPFLFGIARRLVMAHWREAKARNKLMDVHHEAMDAVHGSSAEGKPLDTDLLERAEEIRRLVDQLPDHLAQTVGLVYFEGKTQAEAARILGVRRQRVHDYLKEALDKLAAMLPE